MKKHFLILMSTLLFFTCGCSGKETSASDSSVSETPGTETSSEENKTAEPETEESKTASVRIGDVTFEFTQEGEYFDLVYRYPKELDLEKDESHPRDLLRYHVEGYDPVAFGIVISRRKGYTPEEVILDVMKYDDPVVATEERNGIAWAVGTREYGDNSRNTIYCCAAGEYSYTVSFATDFRDTFDFTEFAEAFVQSIEVK